VMPILLQCANSEARDTRDEAVQAFEKMNAYPIEALPGFISMLKEHGWEHSVASKALKAIGYEKILSLIAALRSGNPDLRNSIFETLGKAGYNSTDPVPLIANMLYADDPELRGAAVYSLGLLGPEASGGVPVLIRALWDTDPGTRWNAATALGKIGASASSALPALQEISKNDVSVDVRRAAVDAVNKITPVAIDPVPMLIEMVRGDDEGLRTWAVKALKDKGPDAKAAVPALIELLSIQYSPSISTLPDTSLCRDIAYTLAEIGPDAADAVPALSILLLDYDYSTVAAAIHALKAIGGDPVPHIISYLKGTDPHVAFLILQSTAGIGHWNEDPFPTFVEAMKGNDFGLRMGADAVLDGTYPDLSYAISVYKELLQKDDPIVRQLGVFMLGLHSPKPREVLPIVEGVLSDQNPFVRATAAITLGYMAPASKEAMPDLIKMLDDEKDNWAKAGAVYAIGMMGKAATDALPKLRELFAKEGPETASYEMMRQTIKRIETGRIRLYPELFD